MTLTLTFPVGERIVTGKQITFESPCESEGLTGVIIDGVEYALVNALGTALVANSFGAGAMVSVTINVENRKAYVQNADTNAYLEEQLAGKAPASHKHKMADIEDLEVTPSEHNQSASTITEGTLAGRVVANSSATADTSVAQVRNIYAGTEDMTAGTTALASGTLYFVYE